MFLDESGDHGLEKDKIDKTYPMFVLVGCIFDLDGYLTLVEPEINKFKLDYFKTTQSLFPFYIIKDSDVFRKIWREDAP